MEELMPSNEVVLETTVIPATTWTESLYFLNDIVDKMEMPQVVKVQGDTENWELTKHVDLRQPFLVYSRRRRTKLFGELLWWDDGKKAWLVDGPLLEIPKDYTGWFEIVQNEGDKLCEFPSAYTTLGQVAEDGCQKLLVRSTMIGHSYTEDSNGLSLKEEMTIFPGELLETCGVAKRKWKIKEKISSLTKEPETKFLKCTDHRNKPVCFPLGHPGQFSPVFDQGRGGGSKGNSKNAVYQVMDLLEESMDYPVHVKLVFGWMPNSLSASPRTWQGVMSLIGSGRPDTVVMCNLSANQNKMPLLEVPIDMDMRVRVAENKPMFSKDANFRQLMKRCYSMVYPFLTSIKYFNIRYKRRDLSSTADSNGLHKQTSRMAAPVDMSRFNPLDIFPPLARAEDISDSWALSFKDPDFDYNNDAGFGGLDISTLSLNTTQSSTSTDASDASLLRTHNRAQKSRQSVSGQAGRAKASPAADPKQRRQAANMRAMKERQISNREATC